jgi:hypothetical protein
MPNYFAPALLAHHNGEIYAQRVVWDSGLSQYYLRLFRRGAQSAPGTAETLVWENGPLDLPTAWHSLFADKSGLLYRKYPSGEITRSKDDGLNWSVVSPPVFFVISEDETIEVSASDQMSYCPSGAGTVFIGHLAADPLLYFGIARYPGPPQPDSRFINKALLSVDLAGQPTQGWVFQEPGGSTLLATNGAAFCALSGNDGRSWDDVSGQIFDPATYENFALCLCPVGGGLAAMANAIGSNDVIFKRNPGAFKGTAWPADAIAAGTIGDSRMEFSLVQAASGRFVALNSTAWARYSDNDGVNWGNW